MIQINLLPDIKQQYLRARRARNTTISIAIIAGIAAGGLVALLVVALLAQMTKDSWADTAIESGYAEMTEYENLSELVTLQNQLGLISSQHENKSVDSRLFRFLQVINPKAPNEVQFSSVTLDPAEYKLTLNGLAERGYPAVESLVKTIMNTNMEYVSGEERFSEPVASNVTINRTSFGESSSGQRVLSFEIRVDFHEKLFVNTAKSDKFVGPDREIDVTDSRIGVPDSLFVAPIKDEDGEE